MFITCKIVRNVWRERDKKEEKREKGVNEKEHGKEKEIEDRLHSINHRIWFDVKKVMSSFMEEIK